jgi:ATP-dependent DNA helicase RecG
VLGTRQTGMLRFRIADLARDADRVEQVPPMAAQLDRAAADLLIERWIGDAEQFADV